ncbi:MAG: aldehyde dehydrogenase family protein, partial [Acetobacteraceae bacterium]|nr:aldehyde dehydrogenase family protein [Acetobacteraceae bacterium]
TPAEAFAALAEAAARDGAPDAPARRAALLGHRAAHLARAEEVARAADADFGGRSRIETLLADVLCVAEAAAHAARNLARWMRPRRAAVPLAFWPARAAVAPRPKGVVGVIAPWNYPVQLALWPAVDALAAGNRVLVKPSEATPRCAELVAQILEAGPGPSLARAVLGGPEVAAALCSLPLGHLLFTGGGATARKVAAAAAANLTPLTLELGGKCPAFVLPGADLRRAARAILVGKALNAGQTCVAPDTVVLIGHSAEAFAEACRATGPHACETAIAPPNRGRFAALREGARTDALSDGATPILLARAGENAPIAREEIFGPALLLHEAATLDDALAAAAPEPLAAYLFGASPAERAQVAARLRAGAIVENRCVDHAAFPALAFGGAGASGHGRYHGEAGFLAFSDLVAEVRHGPFALARLFDAPRGGLAERLIGRLLR